MDAAAAALVGMGLVAGFAGAGVESVHLRKNDWGRGPPAGSRRRREHMWIGFRVGRSYPLYGLVIAFIIMGLHQVSASTVEP